MIVVFVKRSDCSLFPQNIGAVLNSNYQCLDFEKM